MKDRERVGHSVVHGMPWRVIAIVWLATQLVACGSVLDALPGGGGSDAGSGSGSGSSSLSPELASGTLSGVAKDGVIRNATVNVYAWNGAKGELLSSGRTDDRGRYSLELKSRSQSILLEVTGGDYTEEATLRTISLSDGEALYALRNYPTGQSLTTSITYYTTLATGLAENLVRLGMQPPDAVEEANTRVGRILGVDTSNVEPTDILNPNSVSAAELDYGFATAALSSLTERASILNDSVPHRIFTSVRFIQAAYDDVRADGVLNGRGTNTDVVFGRIRLTSEIYRHELALHILRIANNRTANRTGRGPMQMFDLARRLNDSTDPIFGGDPVIPIDNEKPNVSAIVAQEFPNLQNGAVVFGGLSLSAMVATFPGAANAELLLDGQVIGTAEDPENPAVRLETVNPPIADGPRMLTFRVTDLSGAVGESPPLEVILSNQQTTIENITIAGQTADGETPVIVGKRATLVTADIVDPTSPQQVEYSVRPQGATAFVPAATILPNNGATMLQSSASIALNQPQFVDGDATLRVAVTNAFGLVFSREAPFVIDSQNPVVSRILGSRFFNRVSGAACTPRQPPDPADTCLLYLRSGSIDAEVRDNRVIDRVTLAIDGGAAPVIGAPGAPDTFRFNLPNVPDGQRLVTITAVDRAQNSSALRQSVVLDRTAPTISRFELNNMAVEEGSEIQACAIFDDRNAFSIQLEDAGGIDSAVITVDGIPVSVASVVFTEDRTRATVRLTVPELTATRFPIPNDADGETRLNIFLSTLRSLFIVSGSVNDRAGNTTSLPAIQVRILPIPIGVETEGPCVLPQL